MMCVRLLVKNTQQGVVVGPSRPRSSRRPTLAGAFPPLYERSARLPFALIAVLPLYKDRPARSPLLVFFTNKPTHSARRRGLIYGNQNIRWLSLIEPATNIEMNEEFDG